MNGARVCLVTESERTAIQLLERLLEHGAAPEVVGWPEAPRLRGPAAALVAHVDREPEGTVDAFEAWATDAWQPCTLVLLKPVAGSGILSGRLRALQYRRVYHAMDARERLDPVLSDVQAVVERQLWVAGLFARHLSCTDPEFLRAITLAVDAELPARRVKEWAERCRRDSLTDIVNSTYLERFMDRLGIPAPKVILDRLVLSCLHAYAASTGLSSRDQLARHFGYPSGDFLGRCAKRLAGVPLGELLKLAPGEAVAALWATAGTNGAARGA